MKILLNEYDLSGGDYTAALTKMDTLTNFIRPYCNISFQAVWTGVTHTSAFDGVVYPVISLNGVDRIRAGAINIDGASNVNDNDAQIVGGVWAHVGVDVDVGSINAGNLSVYVEGEPI